MDSNTELSFFMNLEGVSAGNIKNSAQYTEWFFKYVTVIVGALSVYTREAAHLTHDLCKIGLI